MKNGVRVAIVVAVDVNNVIGNSNSPDGFPWPKHKADMARFVDIRKGKPLIMGGKSYELVPRKFRPFKNTPTIVVSSSKDFSKEGAIMAKSLKKALSVAGETARSMKADEVVIAGGGQIYREALDSDVVDVIYLTRIMQAFPGDVTFPCLRESKWRVASPPVFRKMDEENPSNLRFFVYERR